MNIQEKWDKIYAPMSVEEGRYPAILDEARHLLPTSGRALDLACGAGAASIFLARHGFTVSAWDVSAVAVRKIDDFAKRTGLKIDAETVDVRAAVIPENAFDVVVVSRFLERDICQALARSLRPGGILLYQTFSVEFVPGGHRMNPAFCLVRGELLELFKGLRPLLYREDALIGDVSRGVRNEAHLVAEQPKPTPNFLSDWIQRVTDERGSLSAVIAHYRGHLASLPDPLGPLLERGPDAISQALGTVAEKSDYLVFAEQSSSSARVLVVPKALAVMPTDLAEAEVARLNRVVTAVCDALCSVTSASHCRCRIPHPSDCATKRMRVEIEPDSMTVDELRQAWPIVVESIQRAIES